MARTPTGPLDLLEIIKSLGFVQLDSIRNVTRAHHHIVWSRNQNYREPMLWDLLKDDRALFEHFTHDASLIPMEFYPMWRRQFPRLKEKFCGSWYTGSDRGDGSHDAIKARIEREGPLSTRAFDTKIKGKKEMWKRPPHKKALDYMWYCGELTTSHRENFVKFYDLKHRVIPSNIFSQNYSDHEQIDWLCEAALDRMGFGTLGDIQKFWDAVSRAEVKKWMEASSYIVPVDIQSYDGSWTESYAPADIETRLAKVAMPTSRLRIINPFDPAIRDRSRLKRLFGMDYKIEIFVPAAKRLYGYYVYPMLEGDTFIGRIEVKADRKKSVLKVHQIWLEQKTKWTRERADKLSSELTRLARLIGVKEIDWSGEI
ncbi:MAG: crosslink repair DNA glycosylase YcaQ family protein [Litorimonas sp.]